ncbi:PPE family protein [Mycobacterium sp. pUA109]|uniref:PPE family protein n=1 Tax=Mycobacterium sp. pUA109 TaxID=3238982 RepID=UPI00351AE9C2
MLDFGALPPEVNSARMYAGPGAGPMMAAAAEWTALATELSAAASSYETATSDLAECWQGPSSISMTTAAAPYIAWMSRTAVQAQQTATQALAAAAAHEAAFAGTVPPPVIAANRAQLVSLVATNFLGQNTPAIAATEAAYAEMWAQDAAVMYGYAASSSVAATLKPFSPPPPTTKAGGQSSQIAAAARAVGTSAAGNARSTVSPLMFAAPQQLQTLTSGAPTSSAAADPAAVDPLAALLTAFGDFNTLAGPLTPAWQVTYSTNQWVNLIYAVKGDFEAHNLAVQPNPTPRLVDATPNTTLESGSAATRGRVLASVGQATPVGGLSVPQSWASATPAASTTAQPPRPSGTGFRALPTWAANPVTSISGETPPVSMGPLTRMTGPPLRKKVLRMRDQRFRMPRPTFGG